jgi:ribosomal protein S18 acetylase RimI-like enzyme
MINFDINLLRKLRKLLHKNILKNKCKPTPKYFNVLIINKKKIIFRHLTKNQSPVELKRFFNAIIKEGSLGVTREQFMTYQDSNSFIAREYNNMLLKKSFYIFGLYRNRIIARGGVKIGVGLSSHICYIADFAVLKDFRRQGIGKFLLLELIRLSKQQWNPKIAQLYVVKKNKPALNLYKKLGFKIVGEIKYGKKIKNKFYDSNILVKYIW